MTSGCYYYSLPGATTRAPSCLFREEVGASKGLERYYRNGGDNGVPEPEWVSGGEQLRVGDLAGHYSLLGFCGEASLT